MIPPSTKYCPSMSVNSTCLILTIGTGTKGEHSNLVQGIINTIKISRPFRFWLLPSSSKDSIAVADLVLDGLESDLRSHFQEWAPGRRFPEIANHDSLEETRTLVTEVIHHARNSFPDAPIVVNPTSGTKQMSAGATLAALAAGVASIVFTTGERADGVVKTGTETITPFEVGRWRAEKDAELASNLWSRNLHAGAAEVLRAASKHLPASDIFRSRLLAVALVADALAHQEAFQFSRAADRLKDARRELQGDSLPQDNPYYRLSRACSDMRRRMEQLAKAQGGERNTGLQRKLLDEVVDNAMRCAASGRFDDAACRLYRAIEMALQIRLAETTCGDYWNGCLRKGSAPPAALNSSGFLTAIRRSELPHELSMEQLARALYALGDQTVGALCGDLDKDTKKSEFRSATARRNASILAHGVTPVDSTGFDALKSVASHFLGMDFKQTHPLPAFDPAWLSSA